MEDKSMPKKIVCNLTTEELTKLYIDECRTLPEMCDIIGIKSPITMRRILNERGISTNANQRTAEKTKCGMSDNEFKSYLEKEYTSGKSMREIGEAIGVTTAAVRKYLVKYGIQRRKNTDFLKEPTTNPNWKGGRRIKDGYIVMYCPDYPGAMHGKYVYEHRYVMEQFLDRQLKSDEVIHHIDRDRANNNISNLLLLSPSEHTLLHSLIRQVEKYKKKRGW